MEDRDTKYCKLCLVTDVKMFSMNTPSILEAYSQLVQVVVCENYQMFICFECEYLLRKCQAFRMKCVTALNVLSSIHMDHSKITKEVIQNIDRKQYNLQSKLTNCDILLCNTVDQMLTPRVCLNTERDLCRIDIDSDVKMLTPRVCLNTERDLCRIDIDSDVKMLTPRVCLNTERDLCKIDIDSDVKMEFDMPIFKFEVNICDSDHNSHDTNVSNKIIPISDDNGYDNIDYVPEIIKKWKQLKKSKENLAESNTYQEQNVSNIEDQPLQALLKNLAESNTYQEQNASNIEDQPLQALLKSKEKILNKKEKMSEDFINQFQDYATIVNLSPEDVVKEILLRKESVNYKMNPHKCDLCYKGFATKSTFENHMKKHSPEYGSWECKYCHQRFPSNNKLVHHMFSSHKRKYICSICPYVSFNGTQATAHMNRHKGKKYECRECKITFSMPNTLSNHKRLKHPTEAVCALCGSAFATFIGMNAHQKLSHRQEDIELVGPKCEECEVQFATETAWKRHLVLSSKHTVLNGCEECGEIFPSRADLKIHMKLHPERKPDYNRYGFKPPAACKICNKWLTTRKEYMGHMTSQHAWKRAKEPVVCEICGISFKTSHLLLEHQYTHTGERPHKCRECGKRFRQRAVWYQHENMHTRKRVFQCDLCRKQYYSKNTLVKHIKAHLGIRPYECSFCHKCFPHKYEVRMHINYVHRKEPWPKRDRTKRKAKQQSAVL